MSSSRPSGPRSAASSTSAAVVAALVTPVTATTRCTRSGMGDLHGARRRIRGVYGRRRRRRAPVAEVDEVLHVPLWAGMTGIADPQHDRPTIREPRGDAGQNIAMDAGVTHHAPFADSLTTGLELRLHEHEAAVAPAQGF